MSEEETNGPVAMLNNHYSKVVATKKDWVKIIMAHVMRENQGKLNPAIVQQIVRDEIKIW